MSEPAIQSRLTMPLLAKPIPPTLRLLLYFALALAMVRRYLVKLDTQVHVDVLQHRSEIITPLWGTVNQTTKKHVSVNAIDESTQLIAPHT